MATISDHPRFKLARALLTGQGGEGDVKSEGNPAAAIDIFAALLEECRSAHGAKSLNAALCQFEYGNALFRAAVRRVDGNANINQDEESEKKPAAKNSASPNRMAPMRIISISIRNITEPPQVTLVGQIFSPHRR